MSKNYKKRPQGAHTKKKTPANQPKDNRIWDFLNNWLWLITLVVIVLLCAVMIIFIPACDESAACTSINSCSAEMSSCKAEDEHDHDHDTETDATVVSLSDVEQFQMPEEGETIAVFDTSMGVIKFRLFPDRAPKSVENFTTHIANGYYDGITFHRVISDFMIQGGDPTATGGGGESIWGGTFEDEFDNGLYNFRGALSMANTGAANSNSSQFFVVQSKDAGAGENDLIAAGMPAWAAAVYQEVGGYPMGDHCLSGVTKYLGHTVFGQVIEGMEVVDAISAVEVNANNAPVEPVTINKAYLEQYSAQ